jgi:hypothetical protein
VSQSAFITPPLNSTSQHHFSTPPSFHHHLSTSFSITISRTHRNGTTFLTRASVDTFGRPSSISRRRQVPTRNVHHGRNYTHVADGRAEGVSPVPSTCRAPQQDLRIHAMPEGTVAENHNPATHGEPTRSHRFEQRSGPPTIERTSLDLPLHPRRSTRHLHCRAASVLGRQQLPNRLARRLGQRDY